MKARLSSVANAGWDAISNVFGWSILFAVVLLSAVSFYGVFYMMYLPAPHHIKPVHFLFRTHGFSPPRTSVDQQRGGKASVNEYSEEFPEAIVNLRLEDKRSAGERILMRGQSYKVSLELTIPNSEVNRGVGMFMTELTFRSKDKITVGSSSRSALIPFSSHLVSLLSSIFDFFFLHFGWKHQSQLLKIVLFEDFVDDSNNFFHKYHPAETARIVIYCKDLQVYSAQLHIESIYTGIRYYMFYWPVTSAAFGIVSNVLLGTIVSFWLYMKFCKKEIEEETEELFEIDENYSAASTVDTESFHEQDADQVQVGVSARMQRGSSQSTEDTPRHRQRGRIRHSPVRRLCGPQRVVARRRSPARDPAISLIRRVSPNVRFATQTKDQECQVDSDIIDENHRGIETTSSTFFDAVES